MAESMKDYEKELEESMKTIEEGDILTGTVISVDEKEVILDLKYYAEGVIPAENYSREPGFSLKDEVHEGDEVSATVVRKDDGQGNILLSRVEAVDVLAWDKLKELKESGEVLDVVVKGITNAGVIAYVEGVRGFIPASKLALNYVEDTEEYLNKPIQVQVLDVDKESKKLILSAKEILRAKAEEERKNKVSNLEIGLVTEGTVESLQPYGAFVNLGNGLSGLVHISQDQETIRGSGSGRYGKGQSYCDQRWQTQSQYQRSNRYDGKGNRRRGLRSAGCRRAGNDFSGITFCKH